MGCDIFDATACAKDSPETVEVIRRVLNEQMPAPIHVALDAGLLLEPPPARFSGSVAGVTGACVCDASGVRWLRVG